MTHLHLDRGEHHAVRHPYADFNLRVADRLGAAFGSMTTFWVCLAVYAVWMFLADVGFWLFAADAFPHPFLLFISNFVQLMALPVLGVIGVRADQKREAKANTDTETFTYIAHRADDAHALATNTHKLAAAIADSLGIDPETGQTMLPRPRS